MLADKPVVSKRLTGGKPQPWPDASGICLSLYFFLFLAEEWNEKGPVWEVCFPLWI